MIGLKELFLKNRRNKLSKTKQYKRLKTAFEHHCVVTGFLGPYKANVLLWLEKNNIIKFYTAEERSKLVDYIWDNLWQ